MGKVKRILLILPLITSLVMKPVYATELIITDNGSGSTNEVVVQAEPTVSVTQTNEAEVVNTVTTNANTGNNTANNNGGEVAITTGNIDETVAVTNQLNSSTVETPCCPSEVSALITGNGEGSNNNINLGINQNNSVTVNNVAVVANNVSGSGNTGGNVANDNNGNVIITTGNIKATSKIANSPVNVYSASVSSGSISLSAEISKNGADSENEIEANIYGGKNIIANNLFVLSNNVNWNLNTGDNFANGNIGDVSIKTGNIVLDILIENLGNVGYVEANCCNDPGDPGDPGDPNPSPTPSPSPSTTPTPSATSTTNNTSSAGIGGPGILGLSATGGLPFNMLMLMAGFGLIIAAYRLCKNYSLEFQFYY